MEEVAAAPLPTLQPADEKHFGQCIRIMVAALPRKNSDDVSGELFVAAYRRKLGHMPTEQINYMTDQALERCKWFPTIAECIEIASGWERNDDPVRDRNRARGLVIAEKQQRMEEAMTRLRDGKMEQDELDALPERWQRIADARGLVLWTEGGFKVRPPRPVEEPAEQSQGDAA